MVERGVRGASLREITLFAGQLNTSAVHYHFANREGLLGAVVLRHVSEIEKRRAELVRELRESDGAELDVRAFAQLLVLPLAAELESESGRRYLQIIDELSSLSWPGWSPDSLAPISKGLAEVFAALVPLQAGLSQPVRQLRARQATRLLLGSLAERARQLGRQGSATSAHPARRRATTPAGADGRTGELLIENLVDVLAVVLTSPSSPHAEAAAAAMPGS